MAASIIQSPRRFMLAARRNTTMCAGLRFSPAANEIRRPRNRYFPTEQSGACTTRICVSLRMGGAERAPRRPSCMRRPGAAKHRTRRGPPPPPLALGTGLAEPACIFYSMLRTVVDRGAGYGTRSGRLLQKGRRPLEVNKNNKDTGRRKPANEERRERFFPFGEPGSAGLAGITPGLGESLA